MRKKAARENKELKMQFNYEELVQDDPVVQHLLAETRQKSGERGKALGPFLLTRRHKAQWLLTPI
jgi:hypothetical protein